VAKQMNVAKARENLRRSFKYRGFLDANGEWDDTVYKDEQSTRLLQNYAAAYVQTAIQLYEDGNFEEAMVELESARKISPNFPGVLFALGPFYERMGRYAEAEAHYIKVLEFWPGHPQVLAQIGHVRIVRGDTAGAIEALNQSIAGDPSSDFNPYADLANIYLQQGNLAEAVACLEQWLKYHPDDKRAKESLQMLRPSVRTSSGGAAGGPSNPGPGRGPEGRPSPSESTQ
jgi:tetratricopeptide (TPR) repeat protein